ncbi:MAG: outer membrane protein Omp31 precursor [Hyphomicrobiales bacterium]|nr:outer membrane protein Omp31 precursor [Hyphomicrobiales bacterium]
MLRSLLFSTALVAVATTAYAADLPARAPAPYPAPVFTWTGFYVGVNGGYAGDKFRYPFSGDIGGTLFAGSASLNSSGFLGGAQIGYNWQFANGIVGGVEADYAFSNVEGKLSLGAAATGLNGSINAGSKLSGLGSVRARVGYGWDRALFFVTGGWAYGRVKSSLNAEANVLGGFSLSTSDNLNGWALGAGVEYALTNNISIKTEYLYVDLGNSTLYSRDYRPNLAASAKLDVETKLHVVRAGVNYRF